MLAVTAHAERRAAGLSGRVGGFAATTWEGLAADPRLAERYAHVVAVDPPPHAGLRALAERLPGDGWTHLAWGPDELEFARRVLAWELDLRPHVADAYRALRAAPPGLTGDALHGALRGAGRPPRSGALAGRVLRVLDELGLVALDRAALSVAVPPPAGRTQLERSPTFVACAARLRDGLAYLAEPVRTRQAAPEAAIA